MVSQRLFQDDFEGNLSGWIINNKKSVTIVDSGDQEHLKVLQLEPDSDTYALIKNSESWSGVRMEGEVMFPTKEHNYLGFIYNFVTKGERKDFGLVYLKGNGSYLRVNPWRDGNVSRLLYEEYKTRINGVDKIEIGKWHRFKIEVIQNEVHVYIGNMQIPKLTFGFFEFDRGMIGLQPRASGGSVWVDNIKVSTIDAFSYSGKNIPDIKYAKNELINSWEFLGPFPQPLKKVENSFQEKSIKYEGKKYTWKKFKTDERGCVVTGRVTEYDGKNQVAYFRTYIHSDKAQKAQLHFTTTDELSIIVNGKFSKRIYRDGYISPKNDWNAWYDFWKNEKHEGTKTQVDLQQGTNEVLIKVRSGQFASGGFFVRQEK